MHICVSECLLMRSGIFLKQTIDKNARLHKYAEIKMNVIKYCIDLNETNSLKKAFQKNQFTIYFNYVIAIIHHIKR